MNELIRGAYDLHVHTGPDILPRKLNDYEMALRVKESGMGGFAAKSHYFCTAERASLVNYMVDDADMIGAITLNSSVGGVNPTALEMAGRAGTKIVWFPTTDSEYELSHVFAGDPNKKLPYWASIITDLQKEGIKVPTIRLLDEEGNLKHEVLEALKVIKKYEMILATSHSSHEETFALVKKAYEMGISKIIITHVDFPTTFYTIEEQLELAEYEAYMEHCYTTWATGKVDFETTLEQIRVLGADRVVLATDLGQKTAKYPDEGLLEFAERLVDNGFTVEEVRKMTVHNPRYLLGLDK
jgi:hypothetical protein